MIYIYEYKNNINGKIYIGQTSNIERRKREHLQNAFRNSDKKYQTPFYKDIRKYGIESFSFSILEEVNKENANEREKEWIKNKKSYFKMSPLRI